jgi:ABC transporter substrate binding protein
MKRRSPPGPAQQIEAVAARETIPTAYMGLSYTSYTLNGSPIVYGIDEDEFGREAGVYTARILRGAKPADLPVQQPATRNYQSAGRTKSSDLPATSHASRPPRYQ